MRLKGWLIRKHTPSRLPPIFLEAENLPGKIKRRLSLLNELSDEMMDAQHLWTYFHDGFDDKRSMCCGAVGLTFTSFRQRFYDDDESGASGMRVDLAQLVISISFEAQYAICVIFRCGMHPLIMSPQTSFLYVVPSHFSSSQTIGLFFNTLLHFST
jgi:hypothetical protein